MILIIVNINCIVTTLVIFGQIDKSYKTFGKSDY